MNVDYDIKRMLFQRYHILILIVMLPLSIHGQNYPVKISGVVLDSVSNKPISNTHIIYNNKNIGVITNSIGSFELIATTFPMMLEFSNIGYSMIHVVLSERKDTNLLVLMQPKTYEFKSVNVYDNKNVYSPKNDLYTVIDYQFLDDKILILLKKRSIGGLSSLLLLNWNFDTICMNNKIPKGATEIFADCLNSYHILTKDSAYQIHITDKNIILLDPFDINWFRNILKDCLFKKGENIFFGFSLNQGYGHEILFINEKDKVSTIFHKYTDTTNFASFIENVTYISTKYFLHTIPNASTNDCTIINHIHRFDIEDRYIREISSKPIKNEIFLLNDTLFYLNYFESKIQIFSDILLPPKEININFSNYTGWGNDIIIDKVKNRVYSIKKSKTTFQIYSVNLYKGNLVYLGGISIFQGENIKINNDYLYYLSIPHNNFNSIKKLNRIKIDNI